MLVVFENSKYIEKVFPSDANFLFLKLKNITAEALQNKLAKYKILIRNCANFDFLDNSYARIAVTDLNEINLLKEALDV